MEIIKMEEKDWLACCASKSFAKQMCDASPFLNYQNALQSATHIWFNKVDVSGWLEAFSAHPQIGQSPVADNKNPPFSQWSKGEQSTALATATDSTLQELTDWNSRYRQKFGFVFLIFASGRSTPEILAELKRRYENGHLVEFENAAKEQMKITELRLSKLFSEKEAGVLCSDSQKLTHVPSKAEEDRMKIIGAHLATPTEGYVTKPAHIPRRTRPPITTHVLDVARGSPADGIEVKLEMWEGNQQLPTFGGSELENWILQGSSVTDKDGRSGQLMSIMEELKPGAYRISFNTSKYIAGGFFPYVSIVFEVKESQKWEHFHVPLLLSPYSFSTYRGS